MNASALQERIPDSGIVSAHFMFLSQLTHRLSTDVDCALHEVYTHSSISRTTYSNLAQWVLQRPRQVQTIYTTAALQHLLDNPCHYLSTLPCILSPLKEQSHASFAFDEWTLASRDLTYGTSLREQPDVMSAVTPANKDSAK